MSAQVEDLLGGLWSDRLLGLLRYGGRGFGVALVHGGPFLGAFADAARPCVPWRMRVSGRRPPEKTKEHRALPECSIADVPDSAYVKAADGSVGWLNTK
ncbi:hypothetical protein GCM10028793_18810 [Nocardiopsis oceani]